jgi:sucrose synthase
MIHDGSYTWKIYAPKVLNMGSTYGFWRTLNMEEKIAKQCYLQMFHR